MKKYFKILLLTFLILTFTLNPIISYSYEISNINLLKNVDMYTPPHRFRKATDPLPTTAVVPNITLNPIGLSNLHISGSNQFSENGLSLIKKSIDSPYNLTIVDLREESHGFINGVAVSFENKQNNANAGLSLEDISKDEMNRLKSIPLKTPIKFYNNGSITPEKVMSEAELTKENKVSYLRIPVTDGNVPSDAMVEYFVNFVKNQPENSWLHFHCKAGIGRTTTFMAMYDILKNCKTVSLNDIINRQVTLAQLSPKDYTDFYFGNHFKFLNDFYNKCQNNYYKLETTAFSETEENLSNINNKYIKNSIKPKYLYIINEDSMSKEEQTMVATLQGVVATKTDSQIYITSNKEPSYEVWLKDLNKNYKIKYKIVDNPWTLLKKFKSYVNGYVLYNSSQPPSINNACSLASLNSSLAIDESIENKLLENKITTLIGDCRNTDKYWAYKNLWNKGLNHSTVIELSPEKSIALRDYAIISKSLVFYEETVNDSTLREMIFSSMDDNSNCLGWGPDEHTNVSITSKYGVDMVAADWSYNLSILSSFSPITYTKKITNKTSPKNNVHYITFIVSDGDNQQWFLGNNYSLKDWYGSPYRGEFNLGWSISSSLYYLAPTVFNKYYESSSYKKYTDDFIVPPSGTGYMYPSKFPFNKLKNYTSLLSEYMKKVDQNYVLILDDEAFHKKCLWDQYTCHSNINGLFYLNYNQNNAYKGEIIWSNNKPIVSCRDLLWTGLEDENQLLENINSRIKSGYINANDPNSYTCVYVHAWSQTMNNIKYVIDNLKENSNVEIVTPTDFMNLITTNVTPY